MAYFKFFNGKKYEMMNLKKCVEKVKTVSKSQKSLCWTLKVSFDDLGQTQKLKEREREERQ